MAIQIICDTFLVYFRPPPPFVIWWHWRGPSSSCGKWHFGREILNFQILQKLAFYLKKSWKNFKKIWHSGQPPPSRLWQPPPPFTPKVSISSTFYIQFFLHKSSFSCYVLALSKNLNGKFAHVTLMKLTAGVSREWPQKPCRAFELSNEHYYRQLCRFQAQKVFSKWRNHLIFAFFAFLDFLLHRVFFFLDFPKEKNC